MSTSMLAQLTKQVLDRERPPLPRKIGRGKMSWSEKLWSVPRIRKRFKQFKSQSRVSFLKSKDGVSKIFFVYSNETNQNNLYHETIHTREWGLWVLCHFWYLFRGIHAYRYQSCLKNWKEKLMNWANCKNRRVVYKCIYVTIILTNVR